MLMNIMERQGTSLFICYCGIIRQSSDTQPCHGSLKCSLCHQDVTESSPQSPTDYSLSIDNTHHWTAPDNSLLTANITHHRTAPDKTSPTTTITHHRKHHKHHPPQKTPDNNSPTITMTHHRTIPNKNHSSPSSPTHKTPSKSQTMLQPLQPHHNSPCIRRPGIRTATTPAGAVLHTSVGEEPASGVDAGVATADVTADLSPNIVRGARTS